MLPHMEPFLFLLRRIRELKFRNREQIAGNERGRVTTHFASPGTLCLMGGCARGRPGHGGPGLAPRALKVRMPQRNRLVIVALSAFLVLAAAAPSRAAAFWQQRIPTAGFAERFWSWMIGLLPGGDSSRTAPMEKEGFAINPNG